MCDRKVALAPFSLEVLNAGGQTVLESVKGDGSGGPARRVRWDVLGLVP
ncbi:hypothetical protein [Polyangium jinanense]|uniref:Uncharacterized protein n=1 Tax=Polyangium jinanense TaxID=2829994 RepID=A0A9X3X098_9BACT|nr:hypothetical protein [Polyangium jinanense]MDC3955416.1 hypothetical protein [Polyangium jinanense]MDC3981717.1 hypothetical protein [Polyangium jinanense]